MPIIYWMVLLFFLLAPPSVHAGPTLPPGAQYKSAQGIYRYEIFIDSNRRIRLYLFDNAGRPLKVTGIEARWVIPLPGGHEENGTFLEGDRGEYFWTSMPYKFPLEKLPIHVEVRKDGRWVPQDFSLALPAPSAPKRA